MTNSPVSQQAAAQELLARRRARESFADFCRYVSPDEPPAEHHLLICDLVDEIVQGDMRRVMVFMPPGSAKSTYATIRAPAYYLGHKGDKGVITASYNDTLATRFGRKVRNLVNTHECRSLFPGLELAADSKAKGEWETEAGGFYFATGVGGGVTGRRADLGIIDDPIKGRKDADSETVRASTWDWYIDDFRTRLKPDGAILIIQTRWHQDDLAGKILPEDWAGESGWTTARDGEQWYVLCLPAEARDNDPLGRQPGQWLWTEWFSPAWWEQTRRTAKQKDIRTWNSLYQQVPKDAEGTYFRREWFPRFRIGDEPRHTHKYQSSDFAVTDDGGDYTEFGMFDIDKHEDIWVTDWWSGQKTPDVWVDAELDMIKKHSPLAVLGEGGVIRRSVEPFLLKRSRERSVYARFEWINRNQDKASMARAFQARAAMGKVHIPHTEWGDALLEQLTAFPAGTNDDKVDVCALIGLALDGTVAGVEPPIETQETLSDYTDPSDEESDESWKLV